MNAMHVTEMLQGVGLFFAAAVAAGVTARVILGRLIG